MANDIKSLENDIKIIRGNIEGIGSSFGSIIDKIEDNNSAVISLLTDSSDGSIWKSFDHVVTAIENGGKSLEDLSKREKDIYNELSKRATSRHGSSKALREGLSNIKKQILELNKIGSNINGYEDYLLADIVSQLDIFDPNEFERAIGQSVISSIKGKSNLGVRKAYEKKISDLEKIGKITSEHAENILKKLKEKNIDSSKDSLWYTGLEDINKMIADSVKKVSAGHSAVKKISEKKDDIKKYDPKKAVSSLISSVDDFVNSLDDNIKKQVSGEYIEKRGSGTVSESLKSGKISIEKYLKQIVSIFNKYGYDVGLYYDNSQKTIRMSVYRKSDVLSGRINPSNVPTFNVPIEIENVLGTGKNAKINKFVRHTSEIGESDFYTEQEAGLGLLERKLKQADRNGKMGSYDYSDINQIFASAIRNVNQTAPGATREAIQESSKSYRPVGALQNAAKSFQISLKESFSNIIYSKGSNLGYKLKNGEDVYGKLFDVYTAVNAATPEELPYILEKIQKDPTYSTIVNSGIWGKIIKDFRSDYERGLRLTPGVTSETSRNTLTVGMSMARDIVPGDVAMAQAQRQQGINILKQSKKNNGVFRKPHLSSAAGSAMGVSYNEEGGWDSVTNVLYVTDDILKEAYKNIGGKGLAPTVREGAMLIDKSVKDSFDTAERYFEKEISTDEYKKLYEEAIKKYSKKYKIEIEKIDKENDDAKKEIEQLMYETLLNKLGRKGSSKKSMLSDISLNDNGNYVFRGIEHVGFTDSQRVTGSYGNTRSAADFMSEKLKRAIADLVGVDPKYFHAVAGLEDKVGMRNYGGIFGRTLAYLTSEEGGYGPTNLENLISALPDGTAKEILSKILIFNDDNTVSVNKEKYQEIIESENAEQNLAILLKTLEDFVNADLKDRGYSSMIDKSGKRVYSIGAENLNIPDAYDYGHYGRAVSLTSGETSLKRQVGAAVASGANITKKEGDQLIKHFEERVGATKESVEKLEKLREEEERVRKMTLSSSESGAEIDSESMVSIGFGSEYDVNLSEVEQEDRDISGEIKNREKTLRGRLEEAKKKKITASGGRLTGKDIKTYIDAKFAGSISYGDGKSVGVVGDRVFLPNYYGEDGGDYFNADVYGLKNALERGDAQEISDAAIYLLARMHNDLWFKEGSEYKKVYRSKTPKTMYNKITGANVSDIISSDDEYKNADIYSKHISDLASYGVLISAKDAKQALLDTDEKNVKDLYEKLYDEPAKEGEKLTKTIDKIIKALTVGSDEYVAYLKRHENDENTDSITGLRAILGRLPFMNGLDLKPSSSIFVEGGRRSGSMRIGAGLARMINADFDGDRVAMAIEEGLSDEIKSVYDKVGINIRKVAVDMARRAKTEAEAKVGYSIGDKIEYDSRANVYSGIISRINKSKTGVVSNLSRNVRNKLTETGYDESALLLNPDDISAQVKAASGMVVRAFFESIEQDSISSKKVIERMIKSRAANNGIDDISKLTKEEMSSNYFDALTDLNVLINNFQKGEVDLSTLVKQLQGMGVLGDNSDLLSGRVIEQDLGVIGQFSQWKDVFAKLGISAEDISAGRVGLSSLQTALGLVSPEGDINKFLSSARIKKGVSDETIDYTQNAIYRLGKNVDLKMLNSEAFERYTASINDAGNALLRESEIEEKKIGIATREAAAMNKLAGSVDKYGKSLLGIPDSITQTNLSQIAAGKPAFFGGESETYNPSIYQKLEDLISGKVSLKDGYTLSDLMEYYGYSNADTFKKQRVASSRAQFGTVVHSINEQLVQRIRSEDVGDLDINKIKQTIIGTKAQDDIEKYLKYLGYEGEEYQEEFDRAINNSLQMIKKIYERLNSANGEIIGVEKKMRGTNSIGQTISQMADLITTEKVGTQKYKLGTVYDYKNIGEFNGVDFQYVNQLIGYLTTLNQIKSVARSHIGSGGVIDYDAVRKEYGANTLTIGNKDYELSNDFINEVANSNWEQGFLEIVDAAGKLYEVAVNIKNLSADLLDANRTGNITEEQRKETMRRAVDPKYLQRDDSGSGGNSSKKSDSDKENESRLKKYNSMLNQQVKLEADIEQYRLRANTTMGKERAANEAVLEILQQKKSKLDEQIAQEEQIELIKNSQEAIEMRETRDLERQIALAKKAAANKGNVTLRDVITRDLGMVGMRFMNFGVISRLISKVPQSLNRVKQTTQQLEQALMNLRVVTGYNRKEGEALLVTYNSLSKQLGATTVEVANAADAWLRQGYSVADAEDLIAASMKLSKLGKIDSAQATKSLKKDSLYSNI